MAHVRDPDRFVDTSHIREVSLDEIEGAHNRVTLGESHGTTELAEQLLWAKRRTGAAIRTRYFAAIDAGDVVAYCQLFDDGAHRSDRGCEHAHRASRSRAWTSRRPACARRGEAGLRPRLPRGPRRRLAEGALRKARIRDRRPAAAVPADTSSADPPPRADARGSSCGWPPWRSSRLLAQVARDGHPRPRLHALPDRLDRRDHRRELPRLAPQCASGLAAVRLAPRARRVPRGPPDRLPGPDGEAVRSGAARVDRIVAGRRLAGARTRHRDARRDPDAALRRARRAARRRRARSSGTTRRSESPASSGTRRPGCRPSSPRGVPVAHHDLVLAATGVPATGVRRSRSMGSTASIRTSGSTGER